MPAELLERRVELIGGCSRRELIEGLNAGAKSYVADLWNMTPNEPGAILRAHKNIERATDNRLAYVASDGDRVRINPKSISRLMIVPRPMRAMDHVMEGLGGPVPAAFFDLALHAQLNACLLYTSDAADERSSVVLGGRRIIKKKKTRRANSEMHRAKTTHIE